jgi:hypothetical protein
VLLFLLKLISNWYKSSLVANTAKILLLENLARTYALVQNTSGIAVTLILGNTSGATLGKGIVLLPYGSYEIAFNNLYVGVVSAISSANVEINLVECVE